MVRPSHDPAGCLGSSVGPERSAGGPGGLQGQVSRSCLGVGAGCWLGFFISSQLDFTPSNRLAWAPSQHGGWSQGSQTVTVNAAVPSRSRLELVVSPSPYSVGQSQSQGQPGGRRRGLHHWLRGVSGPHCERGVNSGRPDPLGHHNHLPYSFLFKAKVDLC